MFFLGVSKTIKQEIADYDLRLLDHPGSAASDEHNWQEFRQYLPILHEGVRAPWIASDWSYEL